MKPRRNKFQLLSSHSNLVDHEEEEDSLDEDQSKNGNNNDNNDIDTEADNETTVDDIVNEKARNEPSAWKYLIWHLVLMILCTVGETIVNASLTVLIPLFATDILGKSEGYAGILTAIQASGNALFNPLSGLIISHTSAECAVLIEYLLRVIVLTIMYLSIVIDYFRDYSFIIWSFMCLIFGITQSLSSIARSTYISLHIPTLNRGRFISYTVAFRRASFVFGPLISGVLSHYYSIATAMLFCALFTLFFCIASTFILIPPKLIYSINNAKENNYSLQRIGSWNDFSQSFQTIGLKRFEINSWILHESLYFTENTQIHQKAKDKNNKKIEAMSMKDVCNQHFKTLFIITMFSFGLKYARRTRKLILTFQSQYLGFSNDKIGYVNTFGYIPDFTMFFIAGNMLDKFGRKSTAIPSLILFIIALSFVSFAQTYIELIFTSIFFGIADGFSIGLLMTIGADLAPQNCRSKFLGFYRMASTSADIIAPIIIGYLSEKISIFYACVSAIIVSTFSLLWVIFFVKETSKQNNYTKIRMDKIESPLSDQNGNELNENENDKTVELGKFVKNGKEAKMGLKKDEQRLIRLNEDEKDDDCDDESDSVQLGSSLTLDIVKPPQG